MMSPHLQHLPWGRVEGLTGREPRGAGAKGPAFESVHPSHKWPRMYNSEAHLGHPNHMIMFLVVIPYFKTSSFS